MSENVVCYSEIQCLNIAVFYCYWQMIR